VSSSPTETTFEVTMPQMGISVAEGTILEWRKRPGDWVEADETVCDASTDKVDVEIPAPAAGRLGRILVEPGETVPVGTVLAELDTAAKPGEAHPQESRAEELAGAAAAPVEQEIDRSRFYSPVVRRLADEHGIDLERVEGTGIGGRVRKRDLLAVLEDGGGPTAPKPLHSESPYRPEPERTLPAAEPLIGPSRREPLSPMRLKIARHMLASRQTSAHCTTIVETDFSTVASRRAELREAMARKGVSLTYLAFVAKAAVAALEQHPVLNASIEDEEIVYHDDVNLGIAVALDEGLIVPVIRKAQRLSLEGMAAAIADLAARARERRLEPDEVGGGTFTITNPGQFGAVLATPIINQPQVAILDLEAIVKRPVVIEQDGAEAIAIRPISYLCMSWDHRALDGAEAARFLGVVKQRLESGRAD
jgi:2-oxoglutarate dehydrogenase complex dihydrolipoamide succinyltransferase (E2) component